MALPELLDSMGRMVRKNPRSPGSFGKPTDWKRCISDGMLLALIEKLCILAPTRMKGSHVPGQEQQLHDERAERVYELCLVVERNAIIRVIDSFCSRLHTKTNSSR